MTASPFTLPSNCFLIAEIGVNHNGDMGLAKEMIAEAKNSGADAVKFQTFRADALVSAGTPKVAYQMSTTSPAESHYDMLKRLELSEPAHVRLFDFCAEMGIEFISTPYDVESAQFLNDLGVRLFKTASADIVDLPLQAYIASTGKPSMAATGMADLSEIREVVTIFQERENRGLLLLHCVSNYPCSPASVNLRAMSTMAREFQLPVGYSDHSEGSLAAALAVALGARVVEKHFTFDKDSPGPDHRASSTPVEFRELVRHVRSAETLLGRPQKEMQPEEAQMASVSRKSLILARAVKAGEALAREDLRLMRPGTGIPARFIGSVVGKRASIDLERLRQLSWTDLADG